MGIDIKDVITLDDDREYVVVSKVTYNEEIYFYLMDVNFNGENSEDGNVGFKILRLNKENQKLAEFDDDKLVQTLIPLFLKEAVKYIDMDNGTLK